MRVDSESVRIKSNPQYLFKLLGSTCAKAARKTLMTSTPDEVGSCVAETDCAKLCVPNNCALH